MHSLKHSMTRMNLLKSEFQLCYLYVVMSVILWGIYSSSRISRNHTFYDFSDGCLLKPRRMEQRHLLPNMMVSKAFPWFSDIYHVCFCSFQSTHHLWLRSDQTFWHSIISSQVFIISGQWVVEESSVGALEGDLGLILSVSVGVVSVRDYDSILRWHQGTFWSGWEHVSLLISNSSSLLHHFSV